MLKSFQSRFTEIDLKCPRRIEDNRSTLLGRYDVMARLMYGSEIRRKETRTLLIKDLFVAKNRMIR